MFERFTDRARRVVVLAQEEARMLNHNYIGTEHILLGLIHEGEGVAAKALESLGIILEAVRQREVAKAAVGDRRVAGKHRLVEGSADLGVKRRVAGGTDVAAVERLQDAEVRVPRRVERDLPVVEIDPAGEKYDPHRHQAMTLIESSEPPGTVVQVFQKGYLLNDRVLRPALVAVAKARENGAPGPAGA